MHEPTTTVQTARVGCFPLDSQLGLGRGAYTERMAQQMVWLSGLLPYEQCREVFERIGKVILGSSSVWRYSQAYGERLKQQVEQHRQHNNIAQVTLSNQDHAGQKGISLDGGMLNIRHEGWKEMKVGAVYDVVQRLERDPQTQEWTHLPHALKTSYTAILGDSTTFAPAVWPLAVLHDVPDAAVSSLTADGAEWIWNLANDYFPDSVQILDWYHARQHLHQAAQALHPDQPQLADLWFARRTDDLFAGNIHAITQDLDKHALADHSHYFHTHKRRMQYLEFRENGFPIGSGTVESAVKQFKTRLTSAGMRWNRSNAQRMLVIRAAVLDHSFDSLWAQAA